MSENNGKQNLEESYTNKYQKHIACSYGYKLVCVDDMFSKPFKTYLGKDAVSKYCCELMKKHFNKEVVMAKGDNEDFKNSTKCWVFDKGYVGTDVNVSDHYHITGKYRSSVYRDCKVNIKLNHKIPIVFNNLNNDGSHLIIQELGKFNYKISVIPNELEKYTRFTISNKLTFIDNFQLLSFSLDSLVKNLSKNDFKYLSQEFDKIKIDLVEQKGFYPYEFMADFEMFKEELHSKEKFYSTLTDRKITDKEYEHVFTVWNNFEVKTVKDYHNLYLKFDVLLLAAVFENFIISWKIMDYIQVIIWAHQF